MRALKAVLKLYLYQVIILVGFFIVMGPLWVFIDRFPYFISAVMSLVYGCTIYSVAWNYGKKDGRKIPGSYPEPIFPVKVSVFASIMPLILLVLRFAAPDALQLDIPLIRGEYDFILTGNRLDGTLDFIFKTWYFPFGLFLGNSRFITYLFAILFLPILFIPGYFVGLKNYKFLDIIMNKLMFVDKKTK